MKSYSNVDKYLKHHEATWGHARESLGNIKNLSNPADYLAALEAVRSMQMANWAAEIVVTGQHGLLKKVLGEIR